MGTTREVKKRFKNTILLRPLIIRMSMALGALVPGGISLVALICAFG